MTALRRLWRAAPLLFKKKKVRDPVANWIGSEVRGNTRPALGHLEMSTDNVRSKYVCFTLNNYTSAEVEAFDRWGQAYCTYYTYGREVGESGTPHLQGYFELATARRFQTLKRTFTALGLDRLHFENRMGNSDQAAEYCHKEGNYTEFGHRSKSRQGKRTDLDNLREDLLQNLPLQEIAQTHFASFIRYQRGINAFRSILAPERNWEMEVRVYWGKTGTGKTRRVYEESEGRAVYSHPGGPWFDGYDQQEIVLFDEFTGSYFALPYLLRLLDRYPMRVPIKGGFVSFVPRIIYITANYAPEAWYTNAKPEHVAALMRRLTDILFFE